MTNLRWLILGCIAAAALTGCEEPSRVDVSDRSKSASPSPTSVATRRPESAPSDTAPKTADAQEEALKIKGLYIGMKISEARDVFNSRFADAIGDKLTIIKNPEGGFLLRPDKPDAADLTNMLLEAMARLPLPLVKSDSEGIVNYIAIPASLGDRMFNSADMDADTFAQEFLESYGIPQLKPFYERSGFANVHNTEQGWEYRSPAGFRLRVHTDKTIEMQATPKQEDRQFD